MTHDWDFWDAKKLPDYRNPGVAILDCDRAHAQEVLQVVANLVRFCATFGHNWRHSRVAVTPHGTITVMSRDVASGAFRPTRYRFVGPRVEQWI